VRVLCCGPKWDTVPVTLQNDAARPSGWPVLVQTDVDIREAGRGGTRQAFGRKFSHQCIGGKVFLP
jgi:hypothetical protein